MRVIITSCTATPELSKIVNLASLTGCRCNSGRSSTVPSSRTRPRSTRPSAAAARNSPRSNVCARLSQTRRSAEATRAGSSSCFPGTSAPMAFTCTASPTGNHARLSSGARDVVTVWMSWQRDANSSREAGRTSQPSERISSQKRWTRAGSRACTRARRQGVTAFSSRSCHRACTPEPRTPTSRSASPHGANKRAASAAAAAVRISVRRPSSKKMASRRVVR
mmetsp:Transcript_136047/g.303040  ORF Transcript_136047/g.303040 Transcript_136047/m.303040 type:complete len:222 (-) Transcript_136047:381-1046(-)